MRSKFLLVSSLPLLIIGCTTAEPDPEPALDATSQASGGAPAAPDCTLKPNLAMIGSLVMGTGSGDQPTGAMTPNWSHVVYKNRNTNKHKLLVFLPGTRSHPDEYSNFLAEASAAGYHVIGLSYWNLNSVNAMSGSHGFTRTGPMRHEIWDFTLPDDSSDDINRHAETTCDDLERREWPTCTPSSKHPACDGSIVSPCIEMSAQDNVRTRLLTLLRVMSWQDANFCSAIPHADWGEFVQDASCLAPGHDFLQECAFKWSKIVIAGHSGGSGESAFISLMKNPSRTLMFSGPADGSDTDDVAIPDNWVHMSDHPERLFGLISLFDDHADPNIAVTAWEQMGMDGSAVIELPNLPGQPSPIPPGAQMLFSLQAEHPHGAPVADPDPLAPAPATTVAAWRYMLNP